MKQRVLIVDDSKFIRNLLSDWVSQEEDMEVIGVAENGKEGVKLASALRPDVITLDIEMPIQDGISALKEIMDNNPIPVLMVSTLTEKGANITMEALEKGAYDFVTKPKIESKIHFRETKQEIISKIRLAKTAKLSLLKSSNKAPKIESILSDKIVVVASSTGGPKALKVFFESLPNNFPAPMVIVQHMPKGFTKSFAARLDGIGNIKCTEASSGDTLIPGCAYVAAGGEHLFLDTKHSLKTNMEPPMHGVRPAADILFNSAAKLHKEKVIGVVLTGMGRDGAQGAMEIKNNGGVVLGEAESTCTVYGMPKAAKQLDAVDGEYPIQEIAHVIVANLVRSKVNAS